MRDNINVLRMKKIIFALALVIAVISLCHCASAAELTQLTTNETDEYDPAWSPDGSKIMYIAPSVRKISGGTINLLWIMDSDGKNKREGPGGLGFFWYKGSPSHPTWRPDGRSVAFVIGKMIYVRVPPDESPSPGVSFNALLPIKESINERDPSWSPDGMQIAFTSYRSGNNDIWVINADGSNLSQLTTHESIDEHPAWSPDATKIAFASHRSGNADIWVMDKDGSNLKQLTTKKSKDFYPAWSSGGTKIAFVSDRSGNKDIWMMDSDGSNIIQLTTDESNDESPTWSPVSISEKMKIAFTSDRAGNKDIWVLEFTSREHEVPGFEAVFTIVGLFAVAYLLKRRK